MGLLKSAVSQGTPQNHSVSHNYIGAESFRTRNPGYDFLSRYTAGEYASVYPSVKAITNEFKTILPFAVDGKGERVKQNPIINALYHPNQEDSSVAFFDKLAAMNLTHRKTYVLVWRNEGGQAKPGGNFGFKGKDIAGFTFLERPGITRRDGRSFYNIGSQEFTDEEVMVIPGGVDPNNLDAGYSPGEASRRWATLDQYIADYQSGFFENGAVPSGQFIIAAASEADYNDTVDAMQEKHRGAGRNNNVTYTPRPIDPNSGKPSEAKIEWIPFASTNKEIDFKNLFEQANNRIDSTYGVPASIRGVGENNNYATAKMDERTFILRAVKPLALSIYTQITHELNRITGGIGVAITYVLPVPAIAEEEKVKADTKKVEVETIEKLITMGYSLEAIVDAMGYDQRYKQLLSTSSSKSIDDDNEDVDDGSEVKKSPNPDEIDGVTPINKSKPKKAKAKVKKPKNELSDAEVESLEIRLSAVITDHMSKQIENYIESLDTNDKKGDPTEEETDEFTDDMMVVIVASMIASGEIQYPLGISLLVDAGINTDDTTSFTLSAAREKEYRDYLKGVAESYGDDTGLAIRNVLSRSEIESWDRNTLEKELRNIMNTDAWRITRLSTSEINRSQDMGSIYSMKQIQDEAEVEFERALLHTGSDAPCEFCKAYIDNWSPLDEDMIQKDEIITGEDGGQLVYTWDNNQGHDVHANGHCVPQFRVAS